jgi:hypothetical protein
MFLVNLVANHGFVIIMVAAVVFCFWISRKSWFNFDLLSGYSFGRRNKLVPYDGKPNPKKYFTQV